jgi:hypothetical protein
MEASTHSNGSRVLTLAPPAAERRELPSPISESTARVLGTIAVLGIAVIHILDSASTYHSTRWIFWAYIALIVTSVPVALVLLHWSSRLAWAVAAGVAVGPLIAYLWSRSIGLPGDAPDIGNWLCTLGMVALFVESALLALTITRIRVGRRAR